MLRRHAKSATAGSTFSAGGCWGDAQDTSLRLQGELSTAQRCKQRYETLAAAKSECEAQSWCGGVSRDMGIPCRGRGSSGQYRFELRTSEADGHQWLSDGSRVISFVHKRGERVEACAQWRASLPKLSTASMEPPLRRRQGGGGSKLGSYVPSFLRGRTRPGPPERIAPGPSPSELRAARAEMAREEQQNSDPLRQQVEEALALSQQARQWPQGGPGRESTYPLISVSALRSLAFHAFNVSERGGGGGRGGCDAACDARARAVQPCDVLFAAMSWGDTFATEAPHALPLPVTVALALTSRPRHGQVHPKIRVPYLLISDSAHAPLHSLPGAAALAAPASRVQHWCAACPTPSPTPQTPSPGPE